MTLTTDIIGLASKIVYGVKGEKVELIKKSDKMLLVKSKDKIFWVHESKIESIN